MHTISDTVTRKFVDTVDISNLEIIYVNSDEDVRTILNRQVTKVLVIGFNNLGGECIDVAINNFIETGWSIRPIYNQATIANNTVIDVFYNGKCIK